MKYLVNLVINTFIAIIWSDNLPSLDSEDKDCYWIGGVSHNSVKALPI